jgi:phosphatidylglycerol:prolipoprotein diacylglycerol transferase
MLTYPKFDPIAIHIPIDFHIGSHHIQFEGIHWYGLMYLLGFVLFMVLGRKRLRTMNRPGWDNRMLDDLLFYGVLGVIVGGRLGQVLFYEPGYFWAHPVEIVFVWQGGMSFHGGFIGVLLAMILFARQHKLDWLQLTDFIAPLAPLGLGAGRIGNFINGELWGRPTDVPWAMIFPHADTQGRHPSQLYEFALEGVALFLILWFFSGKPRPRGAVSGLFLIGYGVFRSLAEFTRNPDTGIFGMTALGVSMGQWLSLPMVAAGIALMAWSYRRARTAH